MNNKQESSQVRKALERVRNQIVDSCSVYHESPKDINGVDCVSVEDINNWFDSELSRIEEEEIDPANKFDFKCVHGYKCKGNKVCEHCGGDRR